MEPEMSRIRISGRSLTFRRRQYSRAGSPCMRMDSRTIRRGSGRVPDLAAAVRLVRRRGGVSRILAMIRRSAASSSGVQAANDLCLSTSTSEAIQPSTASSSCASCSGSVEGSASTPCACADARSMSSNSESGSSAPRKNRPNTSSYRAMSSCRVTSVVRPAQYRSARSAGSSLLSAEQYTRTSPEPTASPAARSSPAKRTSKPVKGSSGTGGDLLEVVADHLEVVSVLDHGAERVLRVGGVQLRLAEEVEGPGPVDGFRHPRRLSQVELAEPVDGGDDLAGQRRGDAGFPDQDDLDLAFGGRVVDPVVKAAPLQRVVQFPGPVGGEHHERRALRLDGADLGDADLEVRQHLKQEGLELVVGPVDLVDQQHGLIAGPDGLEQRPFQQELRAEQLVHGVGAGRLVLGQGPDVQHLPGVIPLVQCLVGVDALVALQPDQLAAER